ncbi:MAG: MFS transporter [Proteobacteria bacterium]|nr:MFS transporter [Pseudomonadota bacterium]
MSRERSFWVPVICGAIILTIGVGTRQSFGIFQKPIAADLGVGRELWSFANAFSMLLMGIFAPFAGRLADRFGTARIVAGGGVLYVTGLLMLGFASAGGLIILGCAVSGIGMSAAGLGPILAAIGRQTSAVHRSLALGLATAGGSFGQFAIVPFASQMQQSLGDWHETMFVLTAISLLMIPLSMGLRENRRSGSGGDAPADPQGAGEALREAFGARGYVLLMIGFFVCGFHVAFVGLHLPSYISDAAVTMSVFGSRVSAIELGGWAIGLVGLFNIVGSVTWGWLGGKYHRKDMLALLYVLRSASFLLFIVLPLSWASVLIFAATLGFLWLGTIPLTSGLIGVLFGPKHVAMLWGIVFFSHQLGSFAGGWGAGRWYDTIGNYNLVWWVAVALGFMAGAIHWFIREEPVARLAPSPG